ncbi:MAG: lipopolysaccharide biosynthesis protein [Chloroflexota bacterium]
MGLARKTLSGIIWAYASYFGRRIFTLLTTAILARLLVPADFGLVAFATIAVTFMETIRGFGINDALIYTDKDVEKAANTAFIFNILIGVGQCAFMFFAAPFALNFIDDPQVVPVMQVLGLIFIIVGFGQTHDALLQKELQFRKRFLPELLATVFKGIVSIILAFTGFGVWAIVYGQLVGAIAQTIAKWYVLRWVPNFRFYIEQARSLWQYGVQVLMFSLLDNALEQADQFFIGIMLGQVQLGFYAIAARIPEMIIANLSLVLTQALFPAYSKLQHDIPRLKDWFIMTTKYTSFLSVPAGIGMSVVAPELVLIVFGDQWVETIRFLQVLALLGMVATLPWSAGDVMKAIGKPDVSTKLLLVESLYTFPMIFSFIYFTQDAVMASLANLISLCITTVLRLSVVSYYLKMNPLRFVTVFRSPFISAGVMALGVYSWRLWVNSMGSPMLLTLLTSIALGGVIYGAMMFLLERDELMNMIETIKKARSGDDDDDEDEEGEDNVTD